MIRVATIDDIEVIDRIEETCFPKSEAASETALIKRIQTFKNSFFVEVVDNQIIGFINGCISDDKTIQDEAYEDVSYHNPNGHYQMIFGLDILPDYQHCRYASGLMKHLLNQTRINGQHGAVLTCKEDLIPFYEQFGFINQGISASTHGQVTWYNMLIQF